MKSIAENVNYFLDKNIGLNDKHFMLLVSVKMILLIHLFSVSELWLNSIMAPILFVPGILLDRVAINKYYISFLTLIFLFIYLIFDLSQRIPNHKHLYTYTLILVTIVLFVRSRRGDWSFLYTKSSRIIIGLCFLFATLGKFLAPEFLDSSFFEFYLLTDSRFFEFTTIIGGVNPNELYDIRAGYSILYTNDPYNYSTALYPSEWITFLSHFLTYWTILIEGSIALTFLSKEGSILYRFRNIFLLIFMVTTYPIATVPGFAMILAVLAFVQSYKDGKSTIFTYLFILIFILIPLSNLPFDIIYNKVTS